MRRLFILALLLCLLSVPALATVNVTQQGDGNYTWVRFTTNLAAGGGQDSTTWDADAAGATEVEYLVVAGGGGGGYGNHGGGGGAGGMRNATGLAVSGTIAVKVGAGGEAPTSSSGHNGANSEFGSIVSLGGGGGSFYTEGNGENGGSGGGSAYNRFPGTGSFGQGNDGGDDSTSGPNYGAGGGGGKSAVGGNGTSTTGGAGGAGASSSITGSAIAYAGGGGGGTYNGGTGGSGGSGGGGTGASGASAGSAGTNGLGGGGGGGGTAGTGAYVGGSGVVIIRYLSYNPPLASFNQTATSGMVGLGVTFNSTSTGSPDSYNWSVYATGTSPTTPVATTQNYTHLFNSGGNFTINLTVTNWGSSTKLGYVDIWNYTSGDFSANETAGIMTLPVQFTATLYNATSLNWSFGDGNYSSVQNPVHTYNGLGVFDVKLFINNPHHSAWINKTGYIAVSTGPIPITIFNGTPTTGVVPLNVSFTDSSTESPTEWNYAFGDGNYSHMQNPIYTYLSAGTYSVSLNATNANGSNTTTKTGYIVVSPMTAAFSANATSGVRPRAIQFTGSSTGVSDAWYWEFGEGNTSAVQNPIHTYGVSGTFNVNMRARNLTSGAFDWENKTAYITITDAADGFNQQDIEMTPAYILTVSVKDTSGNVIPVSTVSTDDGQTYTTTNGTAYFTSGYAVRVVYVSSSGYYSTSRSYLMDEDRSETITLTEATDTGQTNLNQLFPHETTFTLIDRYGNRLDNVTVTAIMESTTVTGNWLQTLFGISDLTTPEINSTLMTGYTDDFGKLAFPMISSGVYTMTFTDTRIVGGVSTKRVTPDQSAFTIVLATIAAEAPLIWGDYINATLYTNNAADPTIYLNLSYNDTSLTTTNIIFYVQYPNYTYAYRVNMPATPSTNQSKVVGYPVQNVRGASYVWGYYANSTFGNLSKSTGITFNGPNGGLLDLFGTHTGWE